MTLTPGSRLGPYEIVAPIGSGGMGEIYEARDTRLERIVAVKVISPNLKAGAPRVLFEGQYTRIGWGQSNYDVSRDGRRVLMIKGEEQALPTQVRLVVNWQDELRRIAPPAR